MLHEVEITAVSVEASRFIKEGVVLKLIQKVAIEAILSQPSLSRDLTSLGIMLLIFLCQVTHLNSKVVSFYCSKVTVLHSLSLNFNLVPSVFG